MDIKSYPKGGTHGGIFPSRKKPVFILEVCLPDTQITNFEPALILLIELSRQQLQTCDF